MNNSNSKAYNRRGGNESTWHGKGRGNGNGSRNCWNQKNSRTESGGRSFPKFADTHERRRENRNDNYHGNDSVKGPGIYNWTREKPSNLLIVPTHINFEQHNECQEDPATNKTVNRPNDSVPIEKPIIAQITDKEINACNSGNSSMSASNHVSEAIETSKLTMETNVSVKIKQEKGVLINLKQEKKSSSSSSSSSGESSSEEDEPKSKKIRAATLEVTPTSNPPSSPLNIKLKPKTNTPVQKAPNIKAVPEPSSTSSSSSSSSSDEESIHQAVPVVLKKKVISESAKNINSSEDDVVCVGNLENKIVLEDEGDIKTDEDILNKKYTKSVKKSTLEKCMICDKKGHNSFQCQMICKNCSAPYHGYRSCPQPANLNTMLQLFIEFCMQQFQNFNAEKQNAEIPIDSVPKPKVDTPHSTSFSNKSSKLKRQQVKANESNAKTKGAKKRKIHGSKKTISKTERSDSSDDNNDDDDADSETSSTESETHISDSSAESLISSKRKRKMKSKNASKSALNLPNFSANPVNLPLVLNGFPNLAFPAASIESSNTSTNALNTLLLTQMFHNAIGSLKK